MGERRQIGNALPIRQIPSACEKLTEAAWSERQPLDLAVNAAPEQPDYLVEGFFERGTVNVLTGDTGTAKSFCALDLAVAVVTGRDTWVGRRIRSNHKRAVVVDEENPARLVRSRARALGLTVESESRLRYFHRLGVQLGAEGTDWTEWLRHELRNAPADLLAIDTGIAATAPEVNDNDQVAALYVNHLRPIASEFDLAIVLLLHEKKPQAGVRTNRSLATMGAQVLGRAVGRTAHPSAHEGEQSKSEPKTGPTRSRSAFRVEWASLRRGSRDLRGHLPAIEAERDPRADLLGDPLRG